MEHHQVDTESIIYEDTIMLNNDPDRYTTRMNNAYLKDSVSDDKLKDHNTIIVEKDTNYCGEKDHGIPFNEFGIAGITEPISNADIHNSAISKKRFSSQNK